MTPLPDPLEPQTFRGSTLEEVLPRIREELGADAVVLRQRTGLAGGVGGFFQHRCVEVVARRSAKRLDTYDEPPGILSAAEAAEGDPVPAGIAGQAMAGGLSSPAIQEIVRQAAPFAEQLQAADEAMVAPAPLAEVEPGEASDHRFHTAADGTWFTAAVSDAVAEHEPMTLPPHTDDEAKPAEQAGEREPAAVGSERAFSRSEPGAVEAEPTGSEAEPTGSEPEPEPARSKLKLAAVEPELAAIASDSVAAPGLHPGPPRPPAVPEPPVAAPAPRGPAPRSGAAAIHERTLMAAGITPALADELVAETVSHAVPFASTRAMKRLLRGALARRIPLATPPGAGGRAIALVGAGGSGKTLTAARIAAAYTAGSDLPVEVLALGSDGGAELGALLAPAGVHVGDGRAWMPLTDSRGQMLTVLDTPAISPSSEADVRTLGALLERLRTCEVHVTVSATMSGPAVRRLLDSLAPLRPHAVVLTHLDEVAHAGPVLDEIMARRLGLSYCGTGTGLDGLAPADPLALATAVLP